MHAIDMKAGNLHRSRAQERERALALGSASDAILASRGKLVVGADIVSELHAAGELAPIVRAAVPDAQPAQEVRPEVLVTEAREARDVAAVR